MSLILESGPPPPPSPLSGRTTGGGTFLRLPLALDYCHLIMYICRLSLILFEDRYSQFN